MRTIINKHGIDMRLLAKPAPVMMALLICLSFTAMPGFAAGEAIVSPKKAKQLIEFGAIDLILDVRTMDEYKSGRINGANLIPVQELEQKLAMIKAFKSKTILVYCHSGVRSNHAQSILKKNGFSNVIDLKGGIVSWQGARLPVVK